MSDNLVERRRNEEYSLGFEETELRLGLPGDGEAARSSGKRGFSEMTGLELKLPTMESHEDREAEKEKVKRSPSSCIDDPEKPPAPKAQVVGWPPVRSFRRNILSARSDKSTKEEAERSSNSATFVKVSMDGAPYLRKVDLKMYRSYQELSIALEKMFSSFTIGNCGLMNASKLMDLLNGSDYVATYEDKDGDWMLVGDVPWEMLVGSCKRLRITKGSEAIGLARATEKYRSRS